MEEWVAKCTREFLGWRGRAITSWDGVEWALREEGADGLPQFSDPEVPCLQFSVLRAVLDGDEPWEVRTYQNVDCGLCAA